MHIGQLLDGDVTRTVAVKRLHRHVAATPGGVAMFEDEARLSANLRHPNIVATLDVLREEDELLLVMEYIHGASLSALERRARERDEPIPLSIVAAIMHDVLLGLEAAHRATDQHGAPMGIVHRDVSPQNVIVGADGVARLLDFGIAKAATQLHTTRDGQLKGKLRYMAPEQLTRDDVTVRADVYGAAVVLWELLTGDKLFVAASEGRTVAKILEGVVIEPSRMRASMPKALDAIVMRGLARAPGDRFASAKDMADALLDVVSAAPPSEVGAWVTTTAPEELRVSAARIDRMEQGDGAEPPPPSARPEHTVTFAREEKRPMAAAARESVPTASAPPPPRPVAKIAVGATAILAAVALAWFAFAQRDRPPATSATVHPEPVAVPTSSTNDEPAPPSLPSASASATVQSAAPVAPRPPARRPARASPASSRAGCSPIYTTGPDGIRRIKPECL